MNNERPILKNESDFKLDSILKEIYSYMRYYSINFNQAMGFINRRYYYIHNHENSYQSNFSFPVIERKPNRNLEEFIGDSENV